ncbi:DUF262 domain-containing protein [Deinococcus sp. KNUC1210]|uniref:DUF262 and DUF1524 domain-containing protein n=1 Tax=Deinococcus sp. KNUC1210 TaxID=2917691 RepID=UPI001EF13A26|nr:DUF262 and DUF1524 domain-containing protein [Deinococcus sp. KNUC1210]ULH16657.1 DUF262 domain-containing protein [Deinococcus sp. KNUC1210]
MIAEQAKLTELLQGIKQFEVPLYQRPYSWGNTEREQFWRDILRAGRDPKPGMHFTGSVVFMERTGSMAGNLKRARLIDGQQRLTTLSLLMLAVAECMAGQEALELPLEGTVDVQRIEASDIREDYLLNKRLTGDSRFKLLPTHADRDTLKFLLGEGPQPTKVSREVEAGAVFFRQRLALPGTNLKEVLRGVHKLQVVSVALEEGRDDPQLIFESLNSTGKDLTQADLIRNNVLMGLNHEQQDELSREYWVPMEARFADTEDGTFDRFMRDFLTLRTRSIPNEQEVFAAFKAYRAARPGDEGVKSLVADVAHLARLYMGVVNPDSLPQAGVQLAMADLAALRVRVVSPFLLELLEDREQGRMTDDTLTQALRLIESFLMRRAVTGERTSPLNRFFAALGRDLHKDGEYLRSLERALVRFQDRDQDGFPSDEVFAAALKTAALYRMNVCKPLLVRLERGMSPKEAFEEGTLTIEHVMPQNDKEDSLSPAWQTMLGPDWRAVQARLVHTLGNLTLTGYNSELGDRPFHDKQILPAPKGYMHSRLLMTRELAALPEWNETRIQERAIELTQRALALWPFPTLTPEELSALRAEGRQRGKVKTVEDHLETSSAALRSLYEQVRARLLKLPGGVREEPQKQYIAYKVAGANFCDLAVQPSLSTLKCWLNIPPSQIDDPHRLTQDITGKGKAGNGNVELVLTLQSDLDAFEALAQQALDYQSARAAGKVSTPEVNEAEAALAALPDVQRQVLAELEARLLSLPGVQRVTNKFYISFRSNRVFLELRARTASLYLSVKGLPSGPMEDPTEEWRSLDDWWHRTIRTLDDLEGAWPTVQAAYDSQQAIPAATAASRTTIRTFFTQILGLVSDLSNVTIETTKNADTFLRIPGQPQHLARINQHNPSGVVELLLNIPFAEVNDPTGRGESRMKHTSLPAGHFSVGLRPGEDEAATSLLTQLFTRYGALRA